MRQRPVRRRHPPQRHHRRGAVLVDGRARRLGRPTGPTTPTSAAAAPGSIPADATEIYQEGLRLPPVRLTDEVRAVLLANSRTPDERAGDLDAQVGANVVGATGWPRWPAQPLDEVLDYGERRMRAALAALPDGSWRFADVARLVRPGADAAACRRRSPWRSRSTGDEVTFDFTGTDPQRPATSTPSRR